MRGSHPFKKLEKKYFLPLNEGFPYVISTMKSKWGEMWSKWISQDGTPPPAVPAQFERCELFLSFREVAIQGNMRAGSATRLPFCQRPHSPPSLHTPLLLLVNKPMTVLLKEEANVNIHNCISARSMLFWAYSMMYLFLVFKYDWSQNESNGEGGGSLLSQFGAENSKRHGVYLQKKGPPSAIYNFNLYGQNARFGGFSTFS